MYIHHTIIKAETYLEYITGKHYDLKCPDQLQELSDILMETGNGYCWDYKQGRARRPPRRND